jgi:hypothetical protein
MRYEYSLNSERRRVSLVLSSLDSRLQQYLFLGLTRVKIGINKYDISGTSQLYSNIILLLSYMYTFPINISNHV